MKNNKITLKNNKIVKAEIGVLYYQDNDDNLIYAECPSLDLLTHGTSYKEAEEMFKDLLNLWVKTINEDGNANEVLKALGWQYNNIPMFPKTYSINPITALSNISASQRLITAFN